MKASTTPADCIKRDAAIISPSPDHFREGADYEETTDVQNLHSAIGRKQRSPLVTIKPFSLWVLVICGLTFFLAGFFWSRYGSNFNGTRVERGNASQSEADLKEIPATLNVSAVD